MIRQSIAAILLVWALGFLWFAMALPQPAGEERTDVVIVPTGSAGRIPHGLEVLEQGLAREMLVTGVDREVKPNEFAAEFGVSAKRMKCCVTLGFAAEDTSGNAEETAAWVRDRKVRSLRLVTADWHMRRTATELARKLPADVVVVRDAVPSRPSLGLLFLEYHKFLASSVRALFGF
ncbi:MAG: YdcF family protein [Alphaproteobacteria bacterium]|nr:MAG: YdcF family protein [Alphaproteobacteria bacterium]